MLAAQVAQGAGQERRARVGCTEAAAVLGVSRKAVMKLAARGLIGTRTLPGVRTLYDLADLRRLAESADRPATASVA